MVFETIAFTGAVKWEHSIGCRCNSFLISSIWGTSFEKRKSRKMLDMTDTLKTIEISQQYEWTWMWKDRLDFQKFFMSFKMKKWPRLQEYWKEIKNNLVM
jgi:hypothetical protein